MLVRLVLFLAILAQAAVVSTGAAHARVQRSTLAAPICRSDATPATPHSPIEHDGACVDCAACCDAHPPVLSVLDEISHVVRSVGRTAALNSAIVLAPPKTSETPPARAPPA